MIIRQADMNDLESIVRIYEDARAFMKETGNPNQWGTTNPPLARTLEDINTEKLYVACDEDSILGVFFYDFANDPTYDIIYNGSWLNDAPYGVMHRVAISKDARGRGVAGFCFEFAYGKCKNLKIDTHKDNIPMQKSLAKNGFTKCGIIHLANGDKRIAYQKTETIS